MSNNEEFEKRGVIEEGRTPPEDDTKTAAEGGNLTEHVTQRLADAAKDSVDGNRNS